MGRVSITKPTADRDSDVQRAHAVTSQVDIDLKKDIDEVVPINRVQTSGTGATPSCGSGNTNGWAARDATGHLAPYRFSRRAVGDFDVAIQIAFAGVSHTDLHQITNEWGNSSFPVVPGQEIVGVVTEVGKNAQGSFKLGDRAGVGCLVRSCRSCAQCASGTEQFCSRRVFTYNAADWGEVDTVTAGGFSNRIVVDHRYVLKVPESLPMDATAPLLCAGITVYSPMKYYGLDKPGMRLGVVGLGGLGHMAVKFAKSFGQEVTVISTSCAKEKAARDTLKADHFILSENMTLLSAAVNTLDGIIDTVSGPHEISLLLPLLRSKGKLILLGMTNEPHSTLMPIVLANRLTIGGSLSGGIKEMQEMLDYCSNNNIVSEVEVIPIDYVNTAMERIANKDVHFRFVIDIRGSLTDEQ